MKMMSTKDKNIGRRILKAGVRMLKEGEILKQKGKEIRKGKKRKDNQHINRIKEGKPENTKESINAGENLIEKGKKIEIEGKKLIKEGKGLLHKEKDS